MDYKAMLKEERMKMQKELNVNKSPIKQVVLQDTAISDSSNIEYPSNIQLELIENFNLDNYKIGIEQGLDSLYYIPNVINNESEEELLNHIAREGKQNSHIWKQLRTRRLQCWGKFPPSVEKTEKNNENTEIIPCWLQNLIDQITSKLPMIFNASNPPNNVLINQYQPQEGILHHTDGPSYVDRVVIISLNSDCLFTFRKNLTSDQIGIEYSGDVFSVLLKRNSLLFFTNDLYTKYLHGINLDQDVQVIDETCPSLNKDATNVVAGEKITKGVRTSLTFRILK